MAWTRQILRVDLTKGTCKAEPLNMAWALDYLGQRGLATKYFIEGVDPKTEPLSPQNKLIFATGPLTGTMASTGGRYSVITKGALTGAIACSNSGGYWGAELKMAGWDMIILEGRSPTPVYLRIENDKAELIDASEIWGKTVWQTEELLKKKHQDPLIRVSSIGRAGETGCLYAAIINDLHRAAGRSGVGTVMGSKNLKAIAVRGTKGVGNIRDFKGFMAATAAGNPALRGITLQRLQSEGAVSLTLDSTTPFAGGHFPTPSGKVELYSPRLADAGLDPLPGWRVDVAEDDGGATDGTWDPGEALSLVTGASHHFVSSSLASQAGLLRHAGTPFVEIHPADAATRRICQGDCVIVENGRGWCKLRAVVTDAVRPGVVVSPKGRWSKLNGGRGVNWTTSDALADMAGQSTFHSNRVWVRRAESEGG